MKDLPESGVRNTDVFDVYSTIQGGYVCTVKVTHVDGTCESHGQLLERAKARAKAMLTRYPEDAEFVYLGYVS